MDLRDASVLVTGAGRGIGRAVALALAREGARLTVVSRTAAELDSLVGEIEARGARGIAFAGDLRSGSSCDAAIAAAIANFGGLQVLVNNAGVGAHAPFAETTEAQFDLLVAVHLKAAFFLTQALLPLLADGGRIVNVSSGLARFALPGYAAYAAMKGGVEVLTRYLAKELGPRRIAVDTVAPGAIETDFGGGAVRDRRELNDYVAAQTALGRVGKPDDIGGVIASLLSEHNRWINAQRIEASGGMFL